MHFNEITNVVVMPFQGGMKSNLIFNSKRSNKKCVPGLQSHAFMSHTSRENTIVLILPLVKAGLFLNVSNRVSFDTQSDYIYFRRAVLNK